MIDIVVSVRQHRPDQATLMSGVPGAVLARRAGNKSEPRVDVALLASALFLQRFTLPFSHEKVVSLSIAPVAMILVYQFISGRLLIQYDRLIWFLLVTLAATTSLLLNFKSNSLTSYSLFLVIYFMFTLIHPKSADQYKRTLACFQLLMLILSGLAIFQFLAQFIVNSQSLLMFFGIFPDSLLPYHARVNTMGIISDAGGLAKSNGIFLSEASTMSQLAAIAILIEVSKFRRPRYLIVLTIGLGQARKSFAIAM